MWYVNSIKPMFFSAVHVFHVIILVETEAERMGVDSGITRVPTNPMLQVTCLHIHIIQLLNHVG